MVLRWIARTTLVVGAFVVGYYASFILLANFFWGDESTMDDFLTPQNKLDILTTVFGLGAAALVVVKTRGLTDGSSGPRPIDWKDLGISLVIGSFVGLCVMVAVNQVLSIQGWRLLTLREYLEPWGVFNGLLALLATFGVSQTIISRRKRDPS